MKEEILNILKLDIADKVEILDNQINEAIKSRDSETKSSVGDKYETGRAMVQAEIGRYQSQLNLLKQQVQVLESVNPNIPTSTVSIGSLVETSMMTYFVSIGIGKVSLDSANDVYAISLHSPIGKALEGKSEGDSFDINGRKGKILRLK